ncbi:hypothetical protein [Roseovarius sp. ZX-A-9]|uniref:hypothetical protein n=1 Tax=Roseovarius sp. ZX-A-9 TaxID=3014783 RepID=UPI00232F390F|nr:hypothetical protein [Roseovarius sp. ZX-A-9]MDX1786052.1 hypothetical protein [Roseovarius sp.]
MNTRWLLRMARWAQNPPSARKVMFVFGIVAVCLALAAFEHFYGWPDALTPNRDVHRGYKP